MPYKGLESALFAKQWKSLCKKDKPLEEKLTKVMQSILANPNNFDSPLKGDRYLSVKKKAVSEHYRIIYRYCERCIGAHKTICAECNADECTPNTIIFEEVFHRDDGY
jgi:mRNA-degrading endonuclease YafQ of YafQ-DinJ toxin-antitoxin module